MLLGLIIGAMTLLCARVILEQLASAGPRIAQGRARAERSANIERWTRDLVDQIETDSSDAAFYGAPDTSRFVSWCRSARGWIERCHALVTIARTDSGFIVTIRTDDQRPVVVRRDSLPLSLRYLAPSDTGLSFITHWDSSIVVPAAIALVGAHDTSFFRIGKRG
jgi:hypothetical protein